MNFKTRILRTQKIIQPNVSWEIAVMLAKVLWWGCAILALCYETYEPDILEKDQVLEALN